MKKLSFIVVLFTLFCSLFSLPKKELLNITSYSTDFKDNYFFQEYMVLNKTMRVSPFHFIFKKNLFSAFTNDIALQLTIKTKNNIFPNYVFFHSSIETPILNDKAILVDIDWSLPLLLILTIFTRMIRRL